MQERTPHALGWERQSQRPGDGHPHPPPATCHCLSQPREVRRHGAPGHDAERRSAERWRLSGPCHRRRPVPLPQQHPTPLCPCWHVPNQRTTCAATRRTGERPIQSPTPLAWCQSCRLPEAPSAHRCHGSCGFGARQSRCPPHHPHHFHCCCGARLPARRPSSAESRSMRLPYPLQHCSA
jgi:hypothetical protein